MGKILANAKIEQNASEDLLYCFILWTFKILHIYLHLSHKEQGPLHTAKRITSEKKKNATFWSIEKTRDIRFQKHATQ